MTYRRKTVEASEASPTGYLFVGSQGRQFLMAGDYIVTSPGDPRLVRQVEFEEFYEPV